MTLLVLVEQHMMRLANGEVWTYDMVNASFWERYLNVFEKIIVCGRIEKRSDNDTAGLAKSSRENVEFVAMPNFRGIKGLIANYFRIRKIIKFAISKADCIIYRAPSPISLVAYPLVRKSQKTFAVELMNNPITQYSKESLNSILQSVIKKYVTKQTRDMCMTANGVSYVTECTLQNMFPCQSLQKEANGYFHGSYSTIQIYQSDYQFMQFGEILPRPLVIAHSGKMNDNRKGQDLLIRVLKELTDKGYDVELRLIGDGVIRKDFERLSEDIGVSNKVSFLGWKTGYKEVQKVLQESHLFVFPSLGEGLPRSVIEAMANGLITIASDVDGLKELLPKDLLVYEHTTEAFTKKISDIIANWEFYNDLRNTTFKKSLCYENSLLTQKRNLFYIKLKECCSKQQHIAIEYMKNNP